MYKSKLEAKTAKFLEDRGIEVLYEKTKLKYTVPSKARTYTPDFQLPSGIFCETKGNFDAASREKMLLVIQQNPDKDIRMLFMRNNRITKKSETRYTDWCEKRGIKCAVSETGEIPEEWLHEKL